MAWSIRGESVIMTQGRGKNATVAMQVDFSTLDKWAKRQMIDVPKITRRSFGRSAEGLRKQLVYIMAHGGSSSRGVPEFHPLESFTELVRSKRGWTGRPIGGILADKKRIVKFGHGMRQVIGWPDKLAKWAIRFQDGDPDDLDSLRNKYERQDLHKLGIKDIPYDYITHPRPVMTPFGNHVNKHLRDWARGAYYKELAKQFRKGVK